VLREGITVRRFAGALAWLAGHQVLRFAIVKWPGEGTSDDNAMGGRCGEQAVPGAGYQGSGGQGAPRHSSQPGDGHQGQGT
jgi:hypothetical protein